MTGCPLSLAIRREHEATHYFTTRLFGRVRSHALDELLADFIGLLTAFGRYGRPTRPQIPRS